MGAGADITKEDITNITEADMTAMADMTPTDMVDIGGPWLELPSFAVI
jgi:hypothetical protein